jgi:hypothetical protein
MGGGYQKPGDASHSSGLRNEDTLWFFTPEWGQAAPDFLMLPRAGACWYIIFNLLARAKGGFSWLITNC